jgi:ABC-type sugar transport system ATPase subunit
MAATFLDVREVSKRYGAAPALERVGFQVAGG